MLPRVVPTNIPGLDEMLGGGVPAGSLLLLEADEVPEAQLIFLQIADEAARQGEKLFFVTMDTSPEEIKKLARKYGWSYGKAEQKKNLYWIDAYSANAKKKGESNPSVIRIESPISLDKISSAVAKVESAFYKNSEYHKSVFLTVNTVARYNSIPATLRFLDYLSNAVKKADAIAFFLLYPDKKLDHVADMLRKKADARIRIYDEEKRLKVEVVDLPFLAFIGRSFSTLGKNKGELIFGKTDEAIPKYTFAVR